MNGLDKIIDNILKNAECEAERVTAAAKAEADEIIGKAQKNADKAIESAKIQAGTEYESMKKREASTSEITKKRILLDAKQQVITRVVEDAKRKIEELDNESYFGLMKRFLERFENNASGELGLSKRDKLRMNTSFAEMVKGKGFTVSEQTYEISGGFILSMGDIEENCSVEAVFESEKEKLYDIVNRFLF